MLTFQNWYRFVAFIKLCCSAVELYCGICYLATDNTLATSDTDGHHHTRLQNVHSHPFYTITPKILSGWVNIYHFFLSVWCCCWLTPCSSLRENWLAGYFSSINETINQFHMQNAMKCIKHFSLYNFRRNSTYYVTSRIITIKLCPLGGWSNSIIAYL